MKTILAAALIMVSFNSFSMRCGTHLINEGDTVARMEALCGTPDTRGLNMEYINKDGDGMSYFIHADTNGVIDSITFSRR